MRFALGMDNREIARALGRTDGATKVLLHRAIKQLEELVAEGGRADWADTMSERAIDIETMLRQALAPVEPPAELAGCGSRRRSARWSSWPPTSSRRGSSRRSATPRTGPASAARPPPRWSARPPPSGSSCCARSASATAGAPQSSNVAELAVRTLRDGGREARQAARRLCTDPRRRRGRRRNLHECPDRPTYARSPTRTSCSWSSAATPRAFEVVYERHSGAAFSLAYRMVGRGNVAEDVVQEAFLSIWRSGARYERARGSVRTWVLGIVHHRAIDQLRRSSVHDKRRASDEGHRGALRGRASAPTTEVARREEAADASARRWTRCPPSSRT